MIRNQHCTVLPGKEEKPTLELSAETQDIMDILTGKLNAMRAFIQGRVHFKGNMSQAMKLTGLFRSDGSILANF
ncbi:MAG: SCP2 sterol-binding domain-containing protein [Methanobacterium sp.]